MALETTRITKLRPSITHSPHPPKETAVGRSVSEEVVHLSLRGNATSRPVLSVDTGIRILDGECASGAL